MQSVPHVAEGKLWTENALLVLEAAFASMLIVETDNILSVILGETTLKNAEIVKDLDNVRNAARQARARRNVSVVMARESPLVVMQ